LGHTCESSFAKDLKCLVGSQRYIQPHTVELQPESGLAKSFVQQFTKVNLEYLLHSPSVVSTGILQFTRSEPPSTAWRQVQVLGDLWSLDQSRVTPGLWPLSIWR
jgi:hypothetical protein